SPHLQSATSFPTRRSSDLSPWRETWNEFKKNKIALAGIIIVLIFILIAIFAFFLAKEGINEQVMSDRLQPPSKEYWLGTDDFGRSEEHTSELQSRFELVCR